MRISDWSSDVCSSDLGERYGDKRSGRGDQECRRYGRPCGDLTPDGGARRHAAEEDHQRDRQATRPYPVGQRRLGGDIEAGQHRDPAEAAKNSAWKGGSGTGRQRSEEHTSELQSLMRISYAVFCLKKKTNKRTNHNQNNNKKTTLR